MHSLPSPRSHRRIRLTPRVPLCATLKIELQEPRPSFHPPQGMCRTRPSWSFKTIPTCRCSNRQPPYDAAPSLLPYPRQIILAHTTTFVFRDPTSRHFCSTTRTPQTTFNVPIKTQHLLTNLRTTTQVIFAPPCTSHFFFPVFLSKRYSQAPPLQTSLLAPLELPLRLLHVRMLSHLHRPPQHAPRRRVQPNSKLCHGFSKYSPSSIPTRSLM